jgi:hypothetical protein
MNAAFNGIAFSRPGGTQTARQAMSLEYFGVVSVQLQVAPGRQAGNTRANDDDFLAHKTSAILLVYFNSRAPLKGYFHRVGALLPLQL